MTRPGPALLFLRDARFRCLGSGGCCTRYDVQQGDTEPWTALRARRDARGGEIVAVVASPVTGRPRLQLRTDPPGRCVLLRDDGLCDVHAVEGVGEKPDLCRLFPYETIDTPDGVVVSTVMECDSYHRTFRDGMPVHLDATAVSEVTARAGALARVGARVAVVATPSAGTPAGPTVAWADYRRLEDSMLQRFGGPGALVPAALAGLREAACALERAAETGAAPAAPTAPAAPAAVDPVTVALHAANHARRRRPDDQGARDAAAQALADLALRVRALPREPVPWMSDLLDRVDGALTLAAARAAGRLPAAAVEPRVARLLAVPPLHPFDAEPLASYYRDVFRQWLWSKQLALEGVVAGAFALTLRWALVATLAAAFAAERDAPAVEPADANAAVVRTSVFFRTQPAIVATARSTLDSTWRTTDVLLSA
ncbi:MAG TPA: hypothetical protein VG389_20050 [Myxococcota bacterium]|nr:hypothetical protein [Myxococcota bacterium]